MLKILKTAAFLSFFLSLSTTNLWATSFIEQPLPDIVSETPVMVRGKVGASKSDWGVGPDGTRRLYTYYELQVREVLKGQAPAGALTLRELGGEKDGVGMQVAGAAHFDRDEDVVLTLSERNSDGSYDLRGLSTGKYTLRQDESGREILVGAGTGGHFDPGHETNPQEAKGSEKVWTLDALRDLIRSQGATGSTLPNTADAKGKTVAQVQTSGPSAAEPQQAPQLQPSPDVEPEGASSESSLSFASKVTLALALGVASWIWFARRRRR